jgi:hypothetical protein
MHKTGAPVARTRTAAGSVRQLGAGKTGNRRVWAVKALSQRLFTLACILQRIRAGQRHQRQPRKPGDSAMTSSPPRLCKTAKAWAMLAQPTPVNRSVRAVLLLANGQRSEQELSMLLGTDVSGLAHGLWVQGYLQPAAKNLFDDGWEDTQAPSPSVAPTSRRPAELRASA